MENWNFWLVIVLVAGVCSRYSYQVCKKEISPALSTWIIFFVGTFLSFLTYMSSGDTDLQSGILNTADTTGDFIIMLSVIAWGKVSKVRFEPFEKYYLYAAGGLVIFWIVSGNPFTSNLLIQVLVSVGYIPTIQKMITEKKNTESFSSWGLYLVVVLVAICPVIAERDTLAIVYAGRSILTISIILIVMLIYRKPKNVEPGLK